MTAHEKNRLELMAEEIEDLKASVSELKDMVKDIHNLLTGNPIDPDSKGLIKDYRETKTNFYKLKEEIKKYKSYFYALVTLVGAGVLKFIFDLIKR
jgi:hypothetical protein